MNDLKWLFIAMAIMFTGMYACLIFEENEKTKRFEICLKEIKDIEKCRSVGGK